MLIVYSSIICGCQQFLCQQRELFLKTLRTSSKCFHPEHLALPVINIIFFEHIILPAAIPILDHLILRIPPMDAFVTTYC